MYFLCVDFLFGAGSKKQTPRIILHLKPDFLKKFQHNGVELTTDLKGYVFGIARNLWGNQLRMKRITVDYDDEFMDSDELERLLETPIEQIVQRSFLKMPEENQKVLTMHLEGRDYDEIALAMGYKSADYARRKKYLSKELLVSLIKEDPDYADYEDFGLRK